MSRPLYQDLFTSKLASLGFSCRWARQQFAVREEAQEENWGPPTSIYEARHCVHITCGQTEDGDVQETKKRKL